MIFGCLPVALSLKTVSLFTGVVGKVYFTPLAINTVRDGSFPSHKCARDCLRCEDNIMIIHKRNDR